MISTNPFTPQSGWEPKAFSGRSDEITLFSEKLQRAKTDKPDHLLVLGDWGIGKTSMLKYFKKLAQEKGYPAAYCPVGRFSQKDKVIDGVWLIAEELSRSLVKSKDQVDPPGKKTALQPQTFLTDKLLNIWEKINAELAVVFLDDLQNFDNISGIVDIIRLVLSRDEIIQNTRYLFVLSCTHSGWQGFIDKHDPVGRFFRTRLSLDKLSRQDTSVLTDKTLIGSGVKFDSGVCENIYKYTQGHPYELQLLCSHLYDSQIEGKVTGVEWERALENTLRDLGRDYFQTLHNQITDRERPVLDILAQNEKSLGLKDIQDQIWSKLRQYKGYPIRDTKNYVYRLVDKNILKKVSRGEYEIFDRMFREYYLRKG